MTKNEVLWRERCEKREQKNANKIKIKWKWRCLMVFWKRAHSILRIFLCQGIIRLLSNFGENFGKLCDFLACPPKRTACIILPELEDFKLRLRFKPWFMFNFRPVPQRSPFHYNNTHDSGRTQAALTPCRNRKPLCTEWKIITGMIQTLKTEKWNI